MPTPFDISGDTSQYFQPADYYSVNGGRIEDVIDFDNIKQYLNIYHDDEDEFIKELARSAQYYVSQITGQAIGEHNYEERYIPAFYLRCRFEPFGQVDIYVYQEDGSATALTPDQFVVSGKFITITDNTLKFAPNEVHPVHVFYQTKPLNVGIGDIPYSAQHAIRILVSTWYYNRREWEAKNTTTVTNLLHNDKANLGTL